MSTVKQIQIWSFYGLMLGHACEMARTDTLAQGLPQNLGMPLGDANGDLASGMNNEKRPPEVAFRSE